MSSCATRSSPFSTCAIVLVEVAFGLYRGPKSGTVGVEFFTMCVHSCILLSSSRQRRNGLTNIRGGVRTRSKYSSSPNEGVIYNVRAVLDGIPVLISLGSQPPQRQSPDRSSSWSSTMSRTLVFDNGAGGLKAGTAGQLQPSHIMPNCTGKVKGQVQVHSVSPISKYPSRS